MSKQQKFLWGQIEWDAGARCLVVSHVHFQIMYADIFWLPLRGASQYGAYPGEQFRKRERFDQIVVRAQLQPFHAVAHAVAGGKKENRRASPVVSEVGDQLPAVLVGQHDIDDEKIELI